MPKAKLSPEDAMRLLGDDIRNRISSQERQAVFLHEAKDPTGRLDDFIRAIFGLEPARHHQEWIDAIHDLEDQPNERLMIISPPGHAKTTVVGVAYPAWRIGNMPDRHFIYYSSTMTQAEKQTQAVRDLMESPAYQKLFPGIRRSATKPWGGGKWYIEREHVWDKDPTMLAMGVDGPALGARADEIIFDDICSPDNMGTKQSREKVKTKISGVAFSRQGGESRRTRMVAIMTRWHGEDMAPWFEREGFKVIWMPAIGYWDQVKPYAAEHGPIRMDEITKLPFAKEIAAGQGAALWPEEYPPSYFTSYRTNSNDVWLLEFQGMISSGEGNIFTQTDFQEWGSEGTKQLDPTSVSGVYTFWDTANTETARSDFWVAQTWAVAADGYYLLHCYMGKHEFPEGQTTVEQFARFAFRVSTTHTGEVVRMMPRATHIEVTGTNNGSALVQAAARKGIPILGETPIGSKVDRANNAVVVLRERPFYVSKEPGRWQGLTFDTFIDQHMEFPRSPKDDIVDTTSQAVGYLAQHPLLIDNPLSALDRVPIPQSKEKVAPRNITRAGAGEGKRNRVTRGMFGR